MSLKTQARSSASIGLKATQGGLLDVEKATTSNAEPTILDTLALLLRLRLRLRGP